MSEEDKIYDYGCQPNWSPELQSRLALETASPAESTSSFDSLGSAEAPNISRLNRRRSPFYSTVVEPSMVRKDVQGGTKSLKKNTAVDTFFAKNKTRRRPNPLHALTKRLAETYELRNARFQYNPRRNPKRALTRPSKPAKNDGYDNENNDYILRVGDILGEGQEHGYRVIDLLGQGTFGQVVKCERLQTNELFSVKVIKNKAAYLAQSSMEVEILKQLKQRISPDDQHSILKFQESFTHKNHLCLVFELLSVNLYELIKQNGFKGLSIDLVRVITAQLLDTLTLLRQAKIIHCDLKPENILLKRVDSPAIKIIDFGSACHDANKMYTYIQSRFYRSPEVLLGTPYTYSIDMWSLGCVVAELFLGIPLFPGSSEYNQLTRITEMLGYPPSTMIGKARNPFRFFNKRDRVNGHPEYTMKTREQFTQEQRKSEMCNKQYFPHKTLEDLILNFKGIARPNPAMSNEQIRLDLVKRHALIDFLKKILEIDPEKRLLPQEARMHPFITGENMSLCLPRTQLQALSSIPRLQDDNTNKNLIGFSPDPQIQADNNNSNNNNNQQQQQQQKQAKTGSERADQHLETKFTGPLLHLMNSVQSLEVAASNTPLNTIPVFQKPRENGIKRQRDFKENTKRELVNGKMATNDKQARSVESGVYLLSTGPQETKSVSNHIIPKEIPMNTSTTNTYLKKEVPFEATNTPSEACFELSRKVKYAPQVRIRFGSQDTFRLPNQIHVASLSNPTQPSSEIDNDRAHKKTLIRTAHVGEAAGGLLMMRQEKKTDIPMQQTSPPSSGGKTKLPLFMKHTPFEKS
ncbi:kinase-like domain-containing protein [Phycomyces nitens]|nr:kinase-like domain-containing protein [Phycomyces nitens]